MQKVNEFNWRVSFDFLMIIIIITSYIYKYFSMKKIILILILSTFFLSSCWKEELVVEQSLPPKMIQSIVLEPKPFTENIKLAGKTTSNQEIFVSPLTSGMIKSVEVKVGDQVKEGDILAVIDTQSNLTNINLNNIQNTYNNTLTIFSTTKEALEKNLENAKIQLENAKIAKDNVYASTQKQLELAQAQLQTVVKQKDNTSKTTTTSIALAQEWLENAKLNLQNFEKNYTETLKGLETKKTSLLENIKISIDNSFATFDGALTSVDTLLWVTETHKSTNDTYEVYLSAKNIAFKNQAENLFTQNNALFITLKWKYSKDFTQEELVAFYSEVIALSDKMVSLFDLVNSVLDYSITSSTFLDATLSSFKASMKANQSQIIGIKSNLVWLNNSLNDLENTITSTTTSLGTQKSTIEQAIKIAQATLDNTLASTSSTIDSISSTENTTKIQLENTITTIQSSRETAENALKIAQNQYNAAKANYESQLAGVKSQLDSATWQKNSLNQQLDNAYIKAPFSGVITSKNIEIGSSVSPASQVFWIANFVNKVVKIDVNSENIKYLQLGTQVQIEKNGKMGTWQISLLSSSADTNTKMFKVEITLSPGELHDYLILWDFVDIFIQKQLGEETFLIIPFSALLVGWNNTYSVYIVGSGSLVEERKVEIWQSNSQEVIIKNGLKANERVIIQGALNISIGDKVQEI